MSRVYYNKLIRDSIPGKMKNKGVEFDVRIIEDEEEYEQELLKKITEEASGLSKVRSRKEFLYEYADLTVVLDTLTSLREFSEADIKLAIEENIKKKGVFKERYFLHWSEDSGYRSNESTQGIKD